MYRRRTWYLVWLSFVRFRVEKLELALKVLAEQDQGLAPFRGAFCGLPTSGGHEDCSVSIWAMTKDRRGCVLLQCIFFHVLFCYFIESQLHDIRTTSLTLPQPVSSSCLTYSCRGDLFFLLSCVGWRQFPAFAWFRMVNIPKVSRPNTRGLFLNCLVRERRRRHFLLCWLFEPEHNTWNGRVDHGLTWFCTPFPLGNIKLRSPDVTHPITDQIKSHPSL